MANVSETISEQVSLNDVCSDEFLPKYILLDLSTYETLIGEEVSAADKDKINLLILTVSLTFEFFCNRDLRARDYSYDTDSAAYSKSKAIFDGPGGNWFFFPTYPVNSVTTFMVSDVVVNAATSYDDSEGYHLYNDEGKLRYDYGFDHGYPQNVKVVWNGGYAENSYELMELQYLCAQVVRAWSTSDAAKSKLQTERLGNYSYSTVSPKTLLELQGMCPEVFSRLSTYRKAVV